jgi:hypothetical protein
VDVVWPQTLSSEKKKHLAEQTRQSTVIGAKLAKENLGLDLTEAKALAVHITRTPGKCNRCSRPIPGEIAVCSQCRAANLDW